jgi:hypothetical protein
VIPVQGGSSGLRLCYPRATGSASGEWEIRLPKVWPLRHQARHVRGAVGIQEPVRPKSVSDAEDARAVPLVRQRCVSACAPFGRSVLTSGESLMPDCPACWIWPPPGASHVDNCQRRPLTVTETDAGGDFEELSASEAETVTALRKCDSCPTPLTGKRTHARYCSARCRQRARRRRSNTLSGWPGQASPRGRRCRTAKGRVHPSTAVLSFAPSIERRGNPMDDHQLPKGISRRSMLKRVGAGAAIAWSAPVLTSLRTPAFGQASPVCAPGCSQCNFGERCREVCRCVGIPVECFCTSQGACRRDVPICQTDEDCGAPGARCARCVFDPSCVETSCWYPCGGDQRVPQGPGIRVIRPSR